MRKIWQGHILIDLIESSNGEIKRMAEVGVWRGNTTKRVLKKCHPVLSQYWAIDPWRQFLVGKAKHLTDEMWTERYMSVCALQRWFPNLHILRMTSLEAAAVFQKAYFDLVFLDADHSYESTLADISAWLPLVNPGGWLTGHDYERESGVNRAVTEFFGKVEVLPEDIWVKRIE